MGIHFDPTISLSTIIEMTVLVGAAFKLWNAIEKRLTVIETRLEPIWDWWNEFREGHK